MEIIKQSSNGSEEFASSDANGVIAEASRSASEACRPASEDAELLLPRIVNLSVAGGS
jgi:hypothetical protein